MHGSPDGVFADVARPCLSANSSLQQRRKRAALRVARGCQVPDRGIEKARMIGRDFGPRRNQQALYLREAHKRFTYRLRCEECGATLGNISGRVAAAQPKTSDLLLAQEGRRHQTETGHQGPYVTIREIR
jgi:hypothetical protein